jgi:hypothetical protein
MAKQKPRKEVSECISTISLYYTRAVDLVKELEEMIQKYGPSVYIDDYYYAYDETKYQAYYFKRLENDAEYEKRMQQEAVWEQKKADQDKAEYERLKKQFEGK